MPPAAPATPRRVIAFDIGIRNFAYTVMDVAPGEVPVVRAMEVADLGVPKNQTQRIIDRTIDLLDQVFLDHLADAPRLLVLIESQMTSVMKAIQTTVNIFFKLNARYQSLDIETRYLSAHHKLALADRFPAFAAPAAPPEPPAAPTAPVSESRGGARRGRYKQNKSDSIRLATWLLEHQYPDPATLQKIRGAKKADDLCDTYLMCVYAATSLP